MIHIVSNIRSGGTIFPDKESLKHYRKTWQTLDLSEKYKYQL